MVRRGLGRCWGCYDLMKVGSGSGRGVEKLMGIRKG